MNISSLEWTTWAARVLDFWIRTYTRDANMPTEVVPPHLPQHLGMVCEQNKRCGECCSTLQRSPNPRDNMSLQARSSILSPIFLHCVSYPEFTKDFHSCSSFNICLISPTKFRTLHALRLFSPSLACFPYLKPLQCFWCPKA